MRRKERRKKGAGGSKIGDEVRRKEDLPLSNNLFQLAIVGAAPDKR